MDPQTRAGKLMAERGFWYREVPQEQRNDRVCKTIMFRRKDGVVIAAVVPYLSRVSYKKMKAHYGMDVSPLSGDELRKEGFEPHECCPQLMTCELLVDPACLEKEPIQTGSGTVGKGIEWHIADLKKIRDYSVLDVQERTA